VRDYWGAEQAAPATVAVTADGKNKNRFRYRATVDLAGLPLEIGRYYEVHAQVPLSDNEPYRNSAGFAIVPIAPAKAFAPEKIPFTSRDWDNRLPDYIRLSDRLGFRIIGLWGGADVARRRTRRTHPASNCAPNWEPPSSPDARRTSMPSSTTMRAGRSGPMRRPSAARGCAAGSPPIGKPPRQAHRGQSRQ
jgi:hypothetical protein